MSADLDTDYLTGWSRDRQSAAQQFGMHRMSKCPSCEHDWHGLPCTKFRVNGCPCKTSIAEGE
jgi:hypothetical protein